MTAQQTCQDIIDFISTRGTLGGHFQLLVPVLVPHVDENGNPVLDERGQQVNLKKHDVYEAIEHPNTHRLVVTYRKHDGFSGTVHQLDPGDPNAVPDDLAAQERAHWERQRDEAMQKLDE